MSITPVNPMPNPAVQPGGSPATGAAGKGAETGNAQGCEGADFHQKLQNNNLQQVNAAQQNATAGVNQANGANSTQRVNTTNSVPDEQDLFGQFDKIRSEMNDYLKRAHEVDTMVAEGKLKPSDPKVLAQHREEMTMLLHFQSEMQNASLKVEVASKVVDNGTNAVKTALQTPAG